MRKGNIGFVLSSVLAVVALLLSACSQAAPPAPTAAPAKAATTAPAGPATTAAAPATSAAAPAAATTAAASAAAATSAAPAAVIPSVYAIGTTYPLGGVYQSIFKVSTTIPHQIAIDEINAAGGIDGVPVKLIVEDNLGTAAGGVSAMQKLVSVDKVPAIITSMSTATVAQAAVAKDYNTLLINPGAVTDALAGASPWLFSIVPNQSLVKNALLYYFAKQLGHKTIGVIWQNDDLGKGTIAYIKRVAPVVGLQVVGDVAIDPAGTDFSAAAIQAKTWNADIIDLGVTQPIPLVVKAMTDVGLKPKALSSSPGNTTSVGPDVIKLGYGSSILNWYDAVQDYNPQRLGAAAQAYAAKYEKAAGTQVGGPAFNNYEAIYAIKALIEQAKKGGGNFYTGERLRQAMIDLKGNITTPVESFLVNTSDGTCLRPLTIVNVVQDATKTGGYNLSHELQSFTLDQVKAMPR